MAGTTKKKAKVMLRDASALSKKQKGLSGAVDSGSPLASFKKAKGAIQRKAKKDSVMGG